MRYALRRLVAAKQALVGALLLLGVVLAGLVGPLVWRSNSLEAQITQRLKPLIGMKGYLPGHPLGTDAVGRDILGRLLLGARVSLLVGLGAVAISALLGIAIGLLAGYVGGKVDLVVMRLGDIQLAFPFILLAISILGVLGPSLLNVILVLGIARWVEFARVVRGEVLAVRSREFIQAARAEGATDWRIVLRHVLPNILAPIIVIASFAVAANIIAESTLSFLGLGVPPQLPTWGAMLAEGRTYLRQAWWLTTLPGAAIALTAMGVNLLGDWLRDFLDPRLRRTMF